MMSTAYRQISSNYKKVELLTLGTRAILVDGRRVDLGAKPELLLVYLAFARGKRVPRSELVSLLWPLADKSKARHSLSQALTALRRLVSIHSHQDTVELATPMTCDYDTVLNLLATDRTDNVFASLNGTFLNGSFIQGSNAFEDWRHTLCVKLNSAIDAWFAAWLEIAIVRSEWQRISTITHDLNTRFGLDPKDLVESEEIRRRIHQAESLSRTTLLTNGSLPFVGRESEIGSLLDAHRQVMRGTPIHVKIVGEAGIGKTRLASVFLDRISSPTSLILRGRCYENDHSSGLRHLTSALRNTACETALTRLEDPWRSILSVLISGDDGRAHEQVAPNPERQNFVFEAFARLFEQISAQTPLVLFLDDVQWAGPSLIELLNHLARGQRGSKFMVIAAGRPTAQEAIEYRSNPEYAIRLGKFGESEVQSLAKEITAVTGCGDLAMQLYQRTSGHPYLLSEVARTIHTAHGSKWSAESICSAAKESAAVYLGSHVTALSSSARHLLNVIAVAGKPTKFHVLRSASGLRTEAFLRALQELSDRALVVDAHGMIEARHDLVRQRTYDGLLVSQRRMLHKRIAKSLLHVNAPAVDLLTHYQKAGLRRSTYISAMRAAASSERVGADGELDMSLRYATSTCKSERKRVALVWRRAERAANRNKFGRAIELFEWIRENASELCEKRSFELDARLLDARLFSGRESGAALREQLVALANSSAKHDTLDSHVMALRTMVRFGLFSGDRELLVDGARRLAHVNESYPDAKPGIEAGIWNVIALNACGEHELASQIIDKLLFQTRARGETMLLVLALGAKAFVAGGLGDLRDARSAGEEALILAERHGLFRLRRILLGNLSTVAMDMSDVIRAEQCVTDIIKTASSSESLSDLGIAHINYAVLLLDTKRYELAVHHANEAIELTSRFHNPAVNIAAKAIIGLASLELGRIGEAKKRIKEVIDTDTTLVTTSDILPVEQFVSRWLERDGKAHIAVSRLEGILSKEKLEIAACCRRGLELELARILIRTNPLRCLQIATDVQTWAQQRGATFLFDSADSLIARLRAKGISLAS